MSALIYVHGLPGAGKTTLCQHLASIRDDIIYVDLGAHPDFRLRRSAEIVADEYLQRGGPPYSLISEGVSSSRASRDRLLRGIRERVTAHVDGNPFAAVRVFRLAPSIEVLASRRDRSVEEYLVLDEGVEEGSAEFSYSVIPPELRSVDEQGAWIVQCITEFDSH